MPRLSPEPAVAPDSCCTIFGCSAPAVVARLARTLGITGRATHASPQSIYGQ